MPTVYCASCGNANRFELDKPVKCAKCAKPFAAAFAGSASVSTSTSYASTRRVKRAVDSDTLDEYIDLNEKEALKAEILASLRGGGIRVLEPERNSIKFDDLLKNPDAIGQFENPNGFNPQQPKDSLG